MAKPKQNLCKLWAEIVASPLRQVRKWRSRADQKLIDHIDRCGVCTAATMARFNGDDPRLMRFLLAFLGPEWKKDMLSSEDRAMLDILIAARAADDKELEDAVIMFLTQRPELLPQRFGLPVLPPTALFVASQTVSMLISRYERHNDPTKECAGGTQFELKPEGNILRWVDDTATEVISADIVIKEICLLALHGRLDNEKDIETARLLVKWLVAASCAEMHLIHRFQSSPSNEGVGLISLGDEADTNPYDAWRTNPYE